MRKITISNITSAPEYITIRRAEYVELKSKATKYDQRKASDTARIQSLNAHRTPKERSELARKAAQARWNKCNLKTEIQQLYDEVPKLESNLKELCKELKERCKD